LLFKQASLLKDAKVKELATQMMKIPDKIRSFVINAYIRRCQFLHSIAYFEWRGHQDAEKAEAVAEMLVYRKYRLKKQAEEFKTAVEGYQHTELG
jgi:hypothetical protein